MELDSQDSDLVLMNLILLISEFSHIFS